MKNFLAFGEGPFSNRVGVVLPSWFSRRRFWRRSKRSDFTTEDTMTNPSHLLTTIGVAAAAIALAAAAGCTRTWPLPAAEKPNQVERGRLLVSIGGCNDCHTPMKFDPDVGMPVPDMSRMLSGHPEGAPEPAAAPAGHDMGVIGAT